MISNTSEDREMVEGLRGSLPAEQREHAPLAAGVCPRHPRPISVFGA